MNPQTKISTPSGRARVYAEAPAQSTSPEATGAAVFHQRFAVEYRYAVHFTQDVFSPTNTTLLCALASREPERAHRLLFVVEAQVARLWPALVRRIEGYVEQHSSRLRLAAAPVVVAGGESSKNDPAVVTTLQSRMNDVGLDRQSFVVCVGGGALQDVAGYAAATTHRGVRMVRVPTTVLSQNDSAVGVKNAVNAFGKKNFLGTFTPPFAVINDARFLETLSHRDKVAGMAEAVKVALIRDAAFYDWLSANRLALAACEPDALAHLVRRCAELHLQHIARAGDPFEFGSARPLDFGHWAAHKLETLTRHRLRHGEAVAIGMAIDVLYSARAGWLSDSVARSVVGLLADLGLPLWDDALEAMSPAGYPVVIDGLTEFREHLGGELTITLLRGIGGGFEVNEIEPAEVHAAIHELKAMVVDS